jgi:intracellular sulfur oxidation DsrE/DsrF family protein
MFEPALAATVAVGLTYAAIRYLRRDARRNKAKMAELFREGVRDPRCRVGIHDRPAACTVRTVTVPAEEYRRVLASLERTGVGFVNAGAGEVMVLKAEPGLDLSLQEESRPFDWMAAGERLICWDERDGLA